MSNDNTMNRRKSDRRRAPRTPTERMGERFEQIMALQDPSGLTPAEATEQAIPDELFGGSEMVIPYMIAGVLGFIAVIVWLVFK